MEKQPRILTSKPWSFYRIAVSLFFTIIIGLAGYFYYIKKEEISRKEKYDFLISITELKIKQLQSWRQERLSDAELISSDDLLVDGIKKWLAFPSPALEHSIQSFFKSLIKNYAYDSVSLFDATGRLRLTADRNTINTGGGSSQLNNMVRLTGKIEMTDLYRGEDRKIYLAIIAPLLVPAGGGTRPIGAVVLRINAEDYLYPLIRSWPVPSATAETLLVRREGNQIVYLNDLRNRENAALSLTIPVDTLHLPAAMAARGQEGLVEGLDYRGVNVLADIRKVPGSPWFIESKIDTAEAFAETHRLFWTVIIIAGLLATIIVAAVVISMNRFQSSQQRRAEQALQESEEKFRLFMEHSPVYVFFKDDQGRSLQLSKNFEKMLGRPVEESLGKTMDELFPPEMAKSMIEDDLRVLREGKPIEVEEEMNGRVYSTLKFPIIKEGKPSFLAGFTMDITDRKQAEEELKLDEERLQALLELTQLKVTSEKELTDFALEAAVRLTRSTGGYLHFFDEKEQVIQLYSWSEDVLKSCSTPQDKHYPLEEAGVWADSARLGKPVIHNDYQTLSDKKGYPEGHFPVVRHLGIPIFDGERIVGATGVGNKATPYDETDARQITLFMNSMWRILKQRRSDEERERLILELQEALKKIKTLRGLLPICASCKKIRDDRGYWEQIDVYLRDHADVDFSHGLCPDCIKKLYPDFDIGRKAQ